jgi:uncharacterized membrane protein
MIQGAHLWAVGYEDMMGAQQLRAAVASLGDEHCLILLDTAVAVRYPDGTLTLNGEPLASFPKLGKHTLASFLAGLALGAPPLSGAAVGGLMRGLGGTGSVGIDDQFIADVAALMTPGTSTLFVLDQVGDMAGILQEIRGLGGTVLRTNVDLERANLIQGTLADAANRENRA